MRSRCARSTIIAAFQARVLGYLYEEVSAARDVRLGKPPLMLWPMRRLGQKNRQRRIINEEEILSTIRAKYAPIAMGGSARSVAGGERYEVDVRGVDLATLPLAEQIALVRSASLLAGAHGAAFAHVVWLPVGAVALELFTRAFNLRMYENYATFAGAHYLRWTNPHQHLETADGLKIDWTSLSPVMHEAVRRAQVARPWKDDATSKDTVLPAPMVERRRRSERWRKRQRRRRQRQDASGGA